MAYHYRVFGTSYLGGLCDVRYGAPQGIVLPTGHTPPLAVHGSMAVVAAKIDPPDGVQRGEAGEGRKEGGEEGKGGRAGSTAAEAEVEQEQPGQQQQPEPESATSSDRRRSRRRSTRGMAKERRRLRSQSMKFAQAGAQMSAIMRTVEVHPETKALHDAQWLLWHQVIPGTLPVVLNLNHCALGDEGALVVAEGLHQNVTVRKLWLCGNSIGPRGFEALADMLTHNGHITSIVLADNDAGR